MRARAVAAVIMTAGLAASAAAETLTEGEVDVAGCWIGEVDELGIGRYTLVLDVGDTKGRVEYRTDFGVCAAALSRLKATPDGSALFLEKLVVGVELCVDQLEVRLRPLGRRSGRELLKFEELEDGQAVVSGALYRSERDSEGRCLPSPELTS